MSCFIRRNEKRPFHSFLARVQLQGSAVSVTRCFICAEYVLQQQNKEKINRKAWTRRTAGGVINLSTKYAVYG